MAPQLMANMSLDQQITGTRRAILSLCGRGEADQSSLFLPYLSHCVSWWPSCRKAAVTSVRNAGPVIEHIEREHPEAFQGNSGEGEELELRNSLAVRRLVCNG